MKKCFIAIALVAILGGCKNTVDPNNVIQKNFGGNRVLRKMTNAAENKNAVSGSFFLFCGDVNATTESRTLLMFAWKMNNGSYQISSLPLTNVRVKFDDKIKSPTIRFNFKEIVYLLGSGTINNTQDYIDKYVNYAELTVKESDWAPDVQLPFNKTSAKE